MEISSNIIKKIDAKELTDIFFNISFVFILWVVKTIIKQILYADFKIFDCFIYSRLLTEHKKSIVFSHGPCFIKTGHQRRVYK